MTDLPILAMLEAKPVRYSYSINNWRQYERTDRVRQGPLKWVTIPSGARSRRLDKLMSRPDGLEAYGLFLCLVQIVSQLPKKVRSGLVCNIVGEPLTPQEIADEIGVPKQVAIDALAMITNYTDLVSCNVMKEQEAKQ